MFTLFLLLAFSVVFTSRAQAQKPSVLIVHADESNYIADVRTKLIATNQLNSVTLFDAQVGTPTLAQLQVYDVVFVYSNFVFSDRVALGNVLASYIDGGKGVVRSTFANYVNLGGNFDSDTYKALSDGTINSNDTRRTLGTVAIPSHPIMQGVSSFDGGSSSYHISNSSLINGATLIASWSHGVPLIAVKNSVGVNGARRVDLNFFPPSSDARFDFWEANTDGAKIMANALVWVYSPCNSFTASLTNDGPLTCTKKTVTLTVAE